MKSLSFFALKGLSSKPTLLPEIRFAIGAGKYTVCRRVCALFGPEILHARAVKG